MISFILFLTCARLRCRREGAGLTRFLVAALYMSCRARLCWLWISRIMRLASALSSRRFCSCMSRIILLPIAFCSLRSRSFICCRCISRIIRFPSFELIIEYIHILYTVLSVWAATRSCPCGPLGLRPELVMGSALHGCGRVSRLGSAPKYFK